ncbi:HD-GYP domain-containing protein [Crassaminicella profunda]|uniref:HD-GYP domain-containing protein n=1 Tax=Crassaminicella profunda TaxID=1286698 RepID=UPI001CA6C52F|nr:HD-GYP domain-containing protein [Crassaminicella profunda]QZY55387.1 HD-GYP domain-containing protein [Crassaminicella profunda]
MALAFKKIHMEIIQKQLRSSRIQNKFRIQTIIRMLEEKDGFTKNHSLMVGSYAKIFGQKLGLSSEDIQELEYAGIIHDIGKITIPDRILLKQSKLTKDEYEIIKKHPFEGYKILKEMKAPKNLLHYVLYHHERADGKGYPSGLKEKEIPYKVRLFSICDAYEAMTGDRPYRDILSKEEALKRLKIGAGSQFDQKLVDSFIRLCL